MIGVRVADVGNAGTKVDVLLPVPTDLGVPLKFDAWRKHQPDAILAIADAGTRFVGCVLPTGAGKSLTVVGSALLAGWRTCVLTSTKLLADQYTADFADAGMVDVRGQGSYECLAYRDEYHTWRDSKRFHGCDDGPCRVGLPCSRKPEKDETHIEKGCLSYDAIARAHKAPLVVTNYAYWLSAHRYGTGLGRFDCLVLDEAHHAPTELADFLSTVLEPGDFHSLGTHGPGGEKDDPVAWARWAKGHGPAVARTLETRPKNRAEMRAHRALKRVFQKLATIAEITHGDWIVQQDKERWHFDPVWVTNHTKVLFGRVPHIVCTSATFTRKTASMLGIPDADLTWHEAPSDFPVVRRPVYYVPCVKVDYRADESQIRMWLATIDNVLRTRRDRKGIIHAVSYDRAQMIARYSEFRDSMILHSRSETKTAVEQFKQAGPGAILVSPSVTTGYDFPGQQCEYQILAKIPFPDRRSPVTAARTQQDPEYPAYIAMQELVQAVGRGMRSAEDQCESLILDSNCGWFMNRYKHLAPAWFLSSYRRCETLPEPLPALGL